MNFQKHLSILILLMLPFSSPLFAGESDSEKKVEVENQTTEPSVTKKEEPKPVEAEEDEEPECS